MYTNSNLSRLSDYILAVVYMHSKNPQKVSELEKRVADQVKNDLPKAVKAKDEKRTSDVLEAIASTLNVSSRDFKLILKGNFLPLLGLMKTSRKKVNSTGTLLRYLKVIAQVNGKSLSGISKMLHKDDSFFTKLVLQDDYQRKKEILLKCVGLFGVSSKSMKDALSRSRIHAKRQPKRKRDKTEDADESGKVNIEISDNFKRRFSNLKSQWFIPANLVQAWRMFLGDLKDRKYKIEKSAKKAYVKSLSTDIDSLSLMDLDEAEKRAKVLYKKPIPSNLMYDPKRYDRDYVRMKKALREAQTEDRKFATTTHRIQIVLDNGCQITVFIHNFSWVIEGTSMVRAVVCLKPYAHRKLSARKRRLLKKFGHKSKHSQRYM